MRVKEESEKAGLKLHIQKKKIMASGPITSWEIDGETVEKITAHGDCSHYIKRCLLLRRNVMTNLDSMLKNLFPWLGKVNILKILILTNLTPKSLQMVTAATKLKDAYSLEGEL